MKPSLQSLAAAAAAAGLAVLLTGCQSCRCCIKPAPSDSVTVAGAGSVVIEVDPVSLVKLGAPVALRAYPKGFGLSTGAVLRDSAAQTARSDQKAPAKRSLEDYTTYSWYRNGVVIESATNQALTIPAMTTNDVGIYICLVSIDELEDATEPPRATFSPPLNLMAYTTHNPLTVYGTPLPNPSGVGTACPAPYRGYISYTNATHPSGGFFMTPKTTNFTYRATDPQSRPANPTRVKWFGFSPTRTACSSTGEWSAAVVDPRPVPPYPPPPSPPPCGTNKFTIYFPSGTFPTDPRAYQIVLDGFQLSPP